MHWSFTRSPLILSYPKIVKWMAIILCFDIPILPPKLWHALKWSFKIGNKDKKLDVEIFRLVRLYISLLLNFNSMNESSRRAVGTRGTRAPLDFDRPFKPISTNRVQIMPTNLPSPLPDFPTALFSSEVRMRMICEFTLGWV